jgi:hypothetical protein
MLKFISVFLVASAFRYIKGTFPIELTRKKFREWFRTTREAPLSLNSALELEMTADLRYKS